MGAIGTLIEVGLIGLLAATLVYAIRLHRAIGVLRGERGGFEDAVAGFDSGARKAEAGVERLREAAQQVAGQLRQAAALKDDLVFLSERGEQLADRLDGLVRAGRGVEAGGASDAPAVRSQAERDLLLALRGAGMRRLPRLRPLPLSIGAMGLLIVMKLGALMEGPGSSSVLESAGRAMVPAAQASNAAETGATRPGGHEAEVPAVAAPAPARAAAPEAAPPPGPPAPSEAERSLLQDLRSRRTELEARAAKLEAREAVLAAAERRLSQQVEQLGAMQARLEALDSTRRERDEANWRGLVKTYESMRPRDAAAIFNELEQPVLMQVLDRMKEAKAAQVLAAMQTDRARAATTELAKWRSRSAP